MSMTATGSCIRKNKTTLEASKLTGSKDWPANKRKTSSIKGISSWKKRITIFVPRSSSMKYMSLTTVKCKMKIYNSGNKLKNWRREKKPLIVELLGPENNNSSVRSSDCIKK